MTSMGCMNACTYTSTETFPIAGHRRIARQSSRLSHKVETDCYINLSHLHQLTSSTGFR